MDLKRVKLSLSSREPGKIAVIITYRFSDARRDITARIDTILKVNSAHPLLRFYIVDSGSPPDKSDEMAAICRHHEATYVFVNTRTEVFSIGKAKDIGAIYAREPYLLFQDADLVALPGVYDQLINEVEIQGLDTNQNNFIIMPCFYLTQMGSEEWQTWPVAQQHSRLMQKYLDGDRSFIVLPALGSSTMLLSRTHYLGLGGHDRSFYGHGFEDFELYHRLMKCQNKFDRPVDYYGDFKDWHTGEYRGLRAMMSLYGEASLKKSLLFVHLWHDTEINSAYTKSTRRNEKILRTAMLAFDRNGRHPPPLPDYHKGRSLLLGDRRHTFYRGNRQVIPEFGQVVYRSEQEFTSTESFITFFTSKNFDRVVFPNPYGNEKRLAIYRACRQHNIPYLVSDRGALDKSIFFDPRGFNYDSGSYNPEYWDRPLTDAERASVLGYIHRERVSDSALEKQGERKSIDVLVEQLNIGYHQKVLFVPMQRPSDTVCRYFANGVGGFKGFVDLLTQLAESLPDDYVMVCKKHPLENETTEIPGAIYAADDTHIKDLINLSDSVLVLNSGVGVLSMLWMKPVLVCGEAFYQNDNLNTRVLSAQEVLTQLENPKPPNEEYVYRFINYLINDFYSFGDQVSEISQKEDGSFINVTREVRYTVTRIPGCDEQCYYYPEHPTQDLNSWQFRPFKYFLNVSGTRGGIAGYQLRGRMKTPGFFRRNVKKLLFNPSQAMTDIENVLFRRQ